MRMELGRRADYSVRAMLYLARHWGSPGRHKARAIATGMGIPEKYVPQVLAALVRTGLVDSEPGPDGGYRLAMSPGEITLLGVIEAVDGPISSEECILRGGTCAREDRCAVHETWASAQRALRARLGETTFAELAVGPASPGREPTGRPAPGR